MKKIAFLVLIVFSIAAQAQHGKGHDRGKEQYTPEQKAVLKTKKMALHLDLTQDQQDKLIEVNKKWSEKKALQRKEFKAAFEGEERPDAEARYQHQLQMMDDQLAYQKEVKSILNKQQYSTWKEQLQDRSSRIQACRKERARRGHGKRDS